MIYCGFGVNEEVWGVLKWCNIWAFRGISLMWSGVFLKWFRVIYDKVRSAKYLGLTITDDLEWGQHISEISCKATKTLGFLRRNLALAPRNTKEVAYKTLVRPQLEYAAPIWHPYNETEKTKVEKVQKTAARWTCRRWHNKSSVDDMLDELEWPSLEDRRVKS